MACSQSCGRKSPRDGLRRALRLLLPHQTPLDQLLNRASSHSVLGHDKLTKRRSVRSFDTRESANLEAPTHEATVREAAPDRDLSHPISILISPTPLQNGYLTLSPVHNWLVSFGSTLSLRCIFSGPLGSFWPFISRSALSTHFTTP